MGRRIAGFGVSERNRSALDVTYQLSVYTLLYVVAALVTASAMPLVWSRRAAPGGTWVFCALVAGAIWAVCDAFEVSALDLPTHVFWAQMGYFGAYPIVVFMLLFSLEFTGRARSSPLVVAGLLVLPAFTILAALTNGSHHWIWTGFAVAPGLPTIVVYSHGWLYWVSTAYGYILGIVVSVLLVGHVVSKWRSARHESIAVLIAALVPWVAEIFHDVAPTVLPSADPSITLSISAAILGVAIVRLGLLETRPVVGAQLIDRLDDAVLVLDARRWIVGANATARALLGQSEPAEKWEPIPVAEKLVAWPELAVLLRNDPRYGDTKATVRAPDGRYFAFRDSPVHDESGASRGSVAALHDVTEFVRTDEALLVANRRLQDQLGEIEILQDELREQAVRDTLTGLYNRRYLSETIKREFGRAEREHYPVSVVMLDIDHFKSINDSRGHAEGDAVLRFLGAQLREHIRPGDMACRFGGDEFVLVLPNTPSEIAARRADKLRASLAESSVYWADNAESTTVSVGVAEFPRNGADTETVLAAADAAMYEAKSEGRNRCVMVSPD